MSMPPGKLAEEICAPCSGATPKLTADEVAVLAREVPGWEVAGGEQLRRVFRFPDFVTALGFVNLAAAVAEKMGHHPDILLAWGKAEFTVWTHAVGGLTRADFVLAARIDQLRAGE